MNIMTKSLVLLLALPLAGCSYFSSNAQSRDRAYLEARSIQPLRIPPGISSSKFHNEYPVSNRNYPPSTIKSDLTPPGL